MVHRFCGNITVRYVVWNSLDYARTCLWFAKLLKEKGVKNWKMYAEDGKKSVLIKQEDKTVTKFNLKLVA